MNKELLINRVTSILSRAGFIISERCDIRPRSFDLAARCDNILLLIKVLYNIDGLNEETAREMQFLSKHLHGHSLIIGEKTRDHFLEAGVVYLRFGIPAFEISTLEDYFIEKIPPLIYAAHGGLYVNIDGTSLKDERMRKNISLGALASMLGVSRRTISKYEQSEMAASVDLALRLEEIMDRGFAVAVGLFEKTYPDDTGKQDIDEKEHPDIFSLLEKMGFNVLPTAQAPFDAVSISTKHYEKATILTGVGAYTSTTVKKAHLMSSISEVTRTQSLLIIHGITKTKNIEGTVLVEEKELKKFDDSDDFINLLQERGRKIQVS
jgi:putative transcriptional regulator